MSKKDIVFPAAIAGNATETACLILENKLQRKLDLPLGRSRFEQNARCSSNAGRKGSPGCVKDVGIAVTGAWRSKVRVIENIKHFHAELNVEIL